MDGKPTKEGKWRRFDSPWHPPRAPVVSPRAHSHPGAGRLAGLRGRWHEWRAARITDPSSRLRYLRQAMGAANTPVRFWNRRGVRIVAAAGIVVLLLVALPAQYPGIVEAVGLERHLTIRGGGEPAGPAEVAPEVWLVEDKGDHEMYSNGLRVETGLAVSNEPRRVLEFRSGPLRVVAGCSRPAGIVFHTTESHLAPFEEGQNQRLRRLGRGVLGYVRERRAYHYLIDRFGRVHRVVKDSDAAWHAGHSIWADPERSYIYLNHSFLAVSFESETKPGDTMTKAVTDAQIHAARTLTQMLRAKYRIPAGNCVTHAQVSVNPSNYRIGHHTDWGGSFPFGDMGLPDNYLQPVAALTQFGFGYDDDFVRATGARMWKGLALSEDQVRQQSTARGVPVAQIRNELRQRYRSVLAQLDGAAPATAGEMAAESQQ